MIGIKILFSKHVAIGDVKSYKIQSIGGIVFEENIGNSKIFIK